MRLPLLFVIAALPRMLSAADGALDTTFGTAGTLETGANWLTVDAWQLGDGRFMLYQYHLPVANPPFRLVRYLENGQPDPAWNIPTGPASPATGVYLYPQPDGSTFYLLGTYQTGLAKVEERRLLATGTVDASYVRVKSEQTGTSDSFLDPGRTWELRETGEAPASSFRLFHMLSSGADDPAWTVPSTYYWLGGSFPDGRLMLGGNNWERLTTSGAIDPTWQEDPATASSQDLGFIPRANGGIYDQRYPLGAFYAGCDFTRLMPTGGVDPAFRSSVTLLSDDEGDFPRFRCVFEQPDGKVLVSGPFWRLATEAFGAPARRDPFRLNADGSMDPSFQFPANVSAPVMGYDTEGLPLGEGGPQFLPRTDGRVLAVFGHKVVRIRAYDPASLTAAVTPRISAGASAGKAALLFSGVSLQQYTWRLERTTDLRTWTKLRDLVPDGTGLRTIEVDASTARAYYRLAR